ncbi:MAG: TetR family transcriptional regulator [Alphaproteobacteria bacterium]|nr:TetR family transcriptional regulator [Alphaproteobacteria bacterium]
MSSTMQPVTLTPAAAATRGAIIDTAERLFRTLGYQKTTVADIARELRMSPANVYRFFPSKAAINEAICARCLAGLDEAAWAIARGPGSAAERIRALFQLLQRETQALFFHERRMHDMVAAALEESWPIVEEHIRTIDTAFRHIVMDGQTAGIFARLDPDETARLLHGSCVIFTHPLLVEKCFRKGEDTALLAGKLADFCLRALRPD